MHEYYCIPDYSNMQYSPVELSLSNNTLTGQIPTELALMTKLCESCCCLIQRILKYFKCVLILCLSCIHTDYLDINDNTFTGEFICPNFVEYCYISCAPDVNENGELVPSNKQECRSL
jgi:hypothetical protein